MIRLEVHGAKKIADKLAKTAREDLKQATREGIEASARRVEQYVKQVELTGGSVRVRSGNLRRSVHVKFSDGGMVARVGTPVVYSAPLEDGATITPKKAKVLAVPLKAALTKAGRSRGGPRDFAGGFWMKRGAMRNPMFFQRRGSALVALFVGLSMVKIEARRPFARTVKATNAGIVRTIRDKIAGVLP